MDSPEAPPATPHDWRTACVSAGVIALWLVLIGRLAYVQSFRRELHASQAQRQQVSEELVAARPGDIVDRRGRLLATAVQAPSLYVDPSRIDDPQALAKRLGEALHLDPVHLNDQLRAHRSKRFLWIKRRMNGEEARAVQQLRLPGEWAGFRMEFQRCYPQGPLAAHVLGLRDIDNVGRGGIEESCDALLRGSDGVRRFVRDARGYVLDVLEEVTLPPADGATVQLTLDAVIQLLAERELDRLMENVRPQGACAVVLDPRTGAVLAMASRPAFDPTSPENAPQTAWKNLSVSAVFEPGSTFKPLVVAWGLDRGLIARDEVFHCEHGQYRMGRRLLHDHHPYGELSLTDVLVKSSNIGMAKIGERLGNASLYDLSRAFGFGRPTGIELPGELAGILHPLPQWTSYSTGSIPMGQELAVTPLQLIAAHAVLANGGRRIAPHLIERVAHKQAHRNALTATLPLVREETCRWLVTGPMTEVVRRGTGQMGQLPGYTVFGKTGTAQKVSTDGRGYSHTRHISSFVCGAPADDPAVLVLVMVDEPARDAGQFGGTVAAPCAAAILEHSLRYLRVPPAGASAQR